MLVSKAVTHLFARQPHPLANDRGVQSVLYGMRPLLVPLVAALLLTSACCHHKRPCPNRYCPPTAPARCCPQPPPAAKPKCGCPGKSQPRRAGLNRHPISLSEVTDYLPGLPPGYIAI